VIEEFALAMPSISSIVSSRRFLALATALLLGSGLPVSACGPFFDDVVFSYKSHPDLPFQRFVGGEVGIIKPGYARSYLVIAYRYLNGKPLSQEEKSAALRLIAYRLGSSLLYPFESVSQAAKDSKGDGGVEPDAMSKWFETRKKVSGVKNRDMTSFDVYRNIEGEDYISYLNCSPDAFATASRTLEAYIAKYGNGGSEVKEWLEGQDQVFSHCTSPGYDYEKKAQRPTPPFPVPLAATASLSQRQDRLYQIAAAKFYSGDFDSARGLFNEIAQDKTSVWNKIAAYMVARTFIREGTLSKDTAKARKALEAAFEKLNSLSRSADFTNLAESIDELKHYVAIRLQPDEVFKELVDHLANGKSKNFYRDLGDFTFVLDKYFDESSDDYSDTHQIANKEQAKLVRSYDLSNWLYSLQDSSPESLNEARKQYAHSKSLPWLLCLASKLKASDKDFAEIKKALANVNGVGMTAARFHLSRLQIESGELAQARATIDQMLAKDISTSDKADLYRLKIRCANSLEDLLKLSFVVPAAVVSGWSAVELPEDFEKIEKTGKYSSRESMLLPESAAFINTGLTLKSFGKLAASPQLKARQKFDFAQAYFVRAYLLKDKQEMEKAFNLLKTLLPKENAAIVSQMQAQVDKQAVGSDQWNFLAAYLILRNPGAKPVVTAGLPRREAFSRIDDYSDNWWSDVSFDEKDDDKPFEVPVKALLEPAAKAEIEKLKALGCAPNKLGSVVVDYASKYSSDKLVPEALHLAVKATRFGAKDEKTTKVSQAAFKLLHSRFKGNVWTQKTPYYY
jgi:hypothetical protein